MYRLKIFLVWLSKLISPPFCEHCHSNLPERTIFCDACFHLIRPVPKQILLIEAGYTVPLFAAGSYSGPMQKLVLAKNYGNSVASVQLAQLIYDRTPFQNLPIDYLIPVPIHYTRRIWRGFNQSELIARKLARLRLGLQVAQPVQRVKWTKVQSALSRVQRQANLKGAFALQGDNLETYRSKNLVVIDDVSTSGATLIAVIKELRNLGPATITVLVAAR